MRLKDITTLSPQYLGINIEGIYHLFLWNVLEMEI